jgi:hypothetical protein
MFDNDQRQRILGVIYTAASGFHSCSCCCGSTVPTVTCPPWELSARFSPGWAIGYWFVPVLNLIRPCEVMLELAWGSDPGDTPSGRKNGNRPRWNLLILIWWIGNIAGGLAGVVFVVSHTPGPRPTPEDLIALSQVVVWVTLAGCALSFLQILIILRIDRTRNRGDT